MTRGCLICLEGIDHSGKTSQAGILRDKLNENGFKTITMRFPDRTTDTGTIINSYLQNGIEKDDHTIHLLYSANSGEMKRVLCEEGVNIILDRYTYSGVAYSAAKDGMTVKWCMEPEKGLIKPDVVLYLDLKVQTAMERISDGTNERYETQAFLERVKSVYDDKLFDKDFWVGIDGSQTIEEVTAQLYDKILSVIAKCKESPLNFIE